MEVWYPGLVAEAMTAEGIAPPELVGVVDDMAVLLVNSNQSGL